MNKQLTVLTGMVDATGEFKNPAEIARQLLAMAKNKLKSKGQVSGIELQSTSEQVFDWENSDGQYRIANLLAIPHWKEEEFLTALKAGDYKAALNCKFAFRLDTDAEVGYGDIVSFKLTEYKNAEGQVGLNVRNLKTERAEVKAISLDDLLGIEAEPAVVGAGEDAEGLEE